MGRKVYVMPRFVPYIEDYLKENNVEIVTGTQANPQDLMENALDCDGFIVAVCPVEREYMETAKNLKVVAKLGVGVDNIDVNAANDLGIWVGFAPQSNSLSVAEITITAICNVSRKYSRMLDATRNNNWQNRLPDLIGQEMEGKTILVIGLGRIGSIVAKKAHFGLGMNVLGYNHGVVDSKRFPDYVEMQADLDEAIKKADYITIHTPLTEETKGMFSKERLALMKPTAYLINMARGAMVDEDALYHAIKDGQIAGAALDVLCVEPPEMDNPLFTLDNVYITPHKASHTKDAQRRMAEHAAMNVVSVLDGKEPVWPYNHPEKLR